MGPKLTSMLAERRAPAADVDLDRMQRHRHVRLQAEMARKGVEVAVLLHAPNVTYATGLPPRAIDVTHAAFERPVAVVVAGEDRPHLLWDQAEPESLVDRHPAVGPELDDGAIQLGQAVAEIAGPIAGRRVAVDVRTGPMLRTRVLEDAELVDASQVVATAKVLKSPDELGCIAEAQRRNEVAMEATQAAIRPGATRAEVAGVFLSRLRELEVEACLIDPIFEPMPRRVADGPRTTTGGPAFPTGVGNPAFAEGDVVWVDTGVDHHGYASDFGRTWIVGRDPDADERRLFERWCEVMVAVLDVLRPGVTGGALCRTAAEASGTHRPWLRHFYLAHGIGVESAEMPLLGTDLGADFDEGIVMAPGMVLVLEPVIWDEGTGGYRAEEIVAVTDDGWRHLGGGHGYEPFAS